METIKTYRNESDGLEALIMLHGNKFKVVMRDFEADATVTVVYGTLEQVTKRAEDFIK